MQRTDHPERFDAMDGLRGVAAMLVLLHHIELTKGDSTWLLHGYLAVDLFFCLSGFVIGHAYERRLVGGMGMGEFLRQRLVRLYPLIALGALLGFVGAVAVRHLMDPEAALALQLLFIPILWGAGDIFLLNGVQWSLLFELLANLGHGLGLKWLSTALLAWIVAASAIALALTARHFGDLGVGWGAQNFWGGFPRVIFSYGAGLLVFRLHRLGLTPVPALPWPLLAAAPFALAFAAGRTDWRGDLLTVYVFPVLVAAAAKARLSPATAKTALLLGTLSYPVYALQGPVKLLIRPIIEPLPLPAEAIGWGFYVFGLFLLSWAAVHYFDEPVRRWLRQARRAPQAL